MTAGSTPDGGGGATLAGRLFNYAGRPCTIDGMSVWDLEASGLGTAGVIVVELTIWSIVFSVAVLRGRYR